MATTHSLPALHHNTAAAIARAAYCAAADVRARYEGRPLPDDTAARIEAVAAERGLALAPRGQAVDTPPADLAARLCEVSGFEPVTGEG